MAESTARMACLRVSPPNVWIDGEYRNSSVLTPWEYASSRMSRVTRVMFS
jgi:hypothetical protein